jgi:hypothetical protein
VRGAAAGGGGRREGRGAISMGVVTRSWGWWAGEGKGTCGRGEVGGGAEGRRGS